MENGKYLSLELHAHIDEKVPAAYEVHFGEGGILGYVLDRIDDHLPNELFYPVRIPSDFTKKRSSRSSDTSDTMLSGYSPNRARSMAAGSRSVPNIWILWCTFSFSMYSTRSMAIEMASSPVEQPGTQIRRVEFCGFVWISSETTFSERTSKASGSLKNRVTPMRKSLWRGPLLQKDFPQDSENSLLWNLFGVLPSVALLSDGWMTACSP